MTKIRQVTQALPAALRAKVEITEAGNDRPEKEVAWYYRFLECGDHVQAALDAGYEDDKASAAGRRLKGKYAEFIREGLIHVGQADLPVASTLLIRVMKAYDPDARIQVKKTLKNGDVLEYEDADPVASSPAMASAAVKAAEGYLDRFGIPKNMKFDFGGDVVTEHDFRLLIDRVVSTEGLEAVKHMPSIMEHKEYRDYFEAGLAAGKYGAGAIDVTRDTVETPTDVTPDFIAPASSGAGDDDPPPASSPAGLESEGTVSIEIGETGQGGPVATGKNGTRVTSPDGATWTDDPSSELDYLGLGD